MDSTKRWILDITAWVAGLMAGMVLIAHEAMASGVPAVAASSRWKAECGSCHVAYPARFLPAQSWKSLMSRLDRHFGTDASLDPAVAAEIGAYLERNAGFGRGAQPAAGSLRITETAWFVDEHQEVPPASWKHAAVKSAANCAACHTAAGQGDFQERNIRIPR